MAEFAAAGTVAGLLLRAAGTKTLTVDPGRPVTSAWLLPILLGVVLAAPLPPPRPAALRRLTSVAVRSLAVSAGALLGLVVLARTVVVNEPTGVAAAALLVLYWTTLGFVGFRLCTLVVRIGRVAEPPGLRRLRAGALLIGAGLASAAAQNLSATVRAGDIGLSVGLAAVTAVLIVIGLDLRRARPVPG